jgi:hypothetical protein
MSYEIRDSFDCDTATFWRVFFDAEYSKALYVGHLKFDVFEIVSIETDAAGNVKRRTRQSPRVEIPAVAKKVIGDSASFTEDGRFDAARQRWTFTVTPATAADKVQTTGEMWCESRGEGKIERVTRIDTKVKIFGIGGVVESFIEKTTRALYTQAAGFTRSWIREHP